MSLMWAIYCILSVFSGSRSMHHASAPPVERKTEINIMFCDYLKKWKILSTLPAWQRSGATSARTNRADLKWNFCHKQRKKASIDFSFKSDYTALIKAKIIHGQGFFSLHQRDSQWHFYLILANIVCMVWGPIFFSSIFLVFNLFSPMFR